MVAGSWCDGERLIPTIFNRYIAGGRYRATGTGAGGDGVGEGVDAKGGCYGVVGGNAVEGIAICRRYREAIYRQGFNVVSGIGADGEGPILTVFNRYVAGGRYRATGTGAGSDGEGINGKAGSDGVVNGNVGEFVAGYRTH